MIEELSSVNYRFYLLCCPVFCPQITGVVIPEVPEAMKESVQTPVVSRVSEGPIFKKIYVRYSR
mgnify:FL=1